MTERFGWLSSMGKRWARHGLDEGTGERMKGQTASCAGSTVRRRDPSGRALLNLFILQDTTARDLRH